MQDHLSAGVGRVDITPPLGTPLAGYADPENKRVVEGVHDPLHATALVFERAGCIGAVINLDAIVVEQEDTVTIRNQIAERTSIPPEHVIVSATQTHSAPRTQLVLGWHDKNHEYVQNTLVPGAIESVVSAFGSMQPVRVGIAEVPCDTGVNRRSITQDHHVALGQNRWAVIDPTMTVLRFETVEGPLANLIHYGAHPTVFRVTNRLASRDWPGVMVDRVEHLTGATTLYLNGAVGDIAPRTNSNRATGDETEDALWEAGSTASLAAMRAWRSIRELRDVPVDVISQTIEIPYRPLPSLEAARRELVAASDRKDQPGEGACNYLHWQAVVQELEAGREKRAAAYPQVILSLGPVAFVPFPGEPFGETILRQRDVSPFQHTLGLSTSCGSYGYFTTRESLHRGGYEVWVAKAFGPYLLGEKVDDALIEQNEKMLKELHSQMTAPWPN